jgi:hypothetical protein
MKVSPKFITAVLFAVLLLVGNALYGQEINEGNEYFSKPVHPESIDKENWKKTIEGLDYNEMVKEEKRAREPKEFKEKPSTFFASISTLVKIILFGGIIALLAYLLIRFMSQKTDKKLKNPKQSFSLEDVEEHLLDIDLKRFLDEALQKKQFGLAVRIYYLMCIKLMDNTHTIQWKKEKTNNQYLIESRQQPFYASFQLLTRIYEKTWFGNIAVNEVVFHRIESNFDDFIKQVKKNGEK